MTSDDPIEALAALDPELHQTVRNELAGKPSVHQDLLNLLAEETLWGISVEPSFGIAIARGFARLAGSVEDNWVYVYRDLIRRAGGSGPAIGLITAVYARDVILFQNQSLLDDYLRTLQIMTAKGTYTLKNPLETLSVLLESGGLSPAKAYMALLRDIFSTSLSYNHCLRLTHAVPKTILNFPAETRTDWINIVRKIIRADIHLFDDFTDGLTRGVRLLNAGEAAIFVSEALNRRARDPKQGKSFLAMESVAGQDFVKSIQTAVSFNSVRSRLNRYIRARTALPISVKPLSEAPGGYRDGRSPTSLAVSDGKHIYLPGEIRRASNASENEALYKTLVKSELAYYEFKTFSFDPVRMADMIENQSGEKPRPGFYESEDGPGLESFFRQFDSPELAEDLFIVFEQARLMRLLTGRYPGMTDTALEPVRKEAALLIEKDAGVSPLFHVYAKLALSLHPDTLKHANSPAAGLGNELIGIFNAETASEPVLVEHCAIAVIKAYPKAKELVWAAQRDDCGEQSGYQRLALPLIGVPHPGLIHAACRSHYQKAGEIAAMLQSHGVTVYKSDIADHLIEHKGELSSGDLKRLIIGRNSHTGEAAAKNCEFTGVRAMYSDGLPPDGAEGLPVFRYPEWDAGIEDYLQDFVRVVERPLPQTDLNFYELTLQRKHHLVKKIRKTFELLKPQQLKILRQWIEGDEFDYRALIDFAIDKKAGRTPSERLYVNRIKQNRDVGVLVLADLSRSTANMVPGLDLTVLDIEKEALVLFCEALNIVGDRYAVAGFSGNGRLGLDFYTVKRFHEAFDASVKGKISGLSPRRNTRMGGAVRHAAAYLEKMNARIRILMILGDGFPNDLEYKDQYAIEDTRKAILEARSKSIAVKAIIVNTASDERLDAIFGPHHYNTIENVEALPDRLLGIYARLTS